VNRAGQAMRFGRSAARPGPDGWRGDGEVGTVMLADAKDSRPAWSAIAISSQILTAAQRAAVRYRNPRQAIDARPVICSFLRVTSDECHTSVRVLLECALSICNLNPHI